MRAVVVSSIIQTRWYIIVSSKLWEWIVYNGKGFRNED